jgi:hypothetical protein
MALQIQQFGDRFAIFDGDDPVLTPMMTPVHSRHRKLLEEVSRAIAKHGDDPEAAFSLYSLQASYLDFGLQVARAELERSVLQIWPDDYFVQRPPDPRLSMPLLALFGPIGMDRAGFAEVLERLRLRQLMSLMVAGRTLGSAVLALRAVEGGQPLTPLALGACARFFDKLVERSMGDGCGGFGGETGRVDPWGADYEYCKRVCCSKKGPGKTLDPRCPVLQKLETLRRFASFPEEGDEA